jgi:hypothetical protein
LPRVQNGSVFVFRGEVEVRLTGLLLSRSSGREYKVCFKCQVLIELASTRPTDAAAIISHLHTLSEGAEFWPAFRAALARIYQHVVAHPGDAGRIANDIYRTVLMLSDVPNEFSFVYHFDDAFSLAQEGTFGDEEMVRKEFIEELRKFTIAV